MSVTKPNEGQGEQCSGNASEGRPKCAVDLGLVAGEGAGRQASAAEAKPRLPHTTEFSASVQGELHGRLGTEGSIRLPRHCS